MLCAWSLTNKYKSLTHYNNLVILLLSILNTFKCILLMNASISIFCRLLFLSRIAYFIITHSQGITLIELQTENVACENMCWVDIVDYLQISSKYPYVAIALPILKKH